MKMSLWSWKVWNNLTNQRLPSASNAFSSFTLWRVFLSE
eukprot:CAMPEP_0198585304 /NCGR_PEP_ID=MMETSP1462-20131121/129152_1 /TAXON_ID=1333877 /ORGANISM="Brandtodinium nutriculum, Strain RCC3387" /LENGTH=38 /DNA_ID= /DNA_START= /DNA_END= /DNA_ORIENTATION=